MIPSVELSICLNRAEEQEEAGSMPPHRDHALLSMFCTPPYLNVTGEVSAEALRRHVAQCQEVLAEMEARAAAVAEDLT